MILLKILSLLRKEAKEFFENTTVHGFRYILVSKTAFCKLFWVLSLLSSISLCLFLIGQSLKESRDNPIQTITEEIEVNSLPCQPSRS